jgi:SAM-dependent methyltransferase
MNTQNSSLWENNTLGRAQTAASAAWDAEYQAGRYATEPPVPFVHDILTVGRAHGLTGGHGLYIGCGNGRNYLPLTRAGLNLTGLDISHQALRQLAARAPENHNRLIHGDLSALPPGQTFDLIIGIQVFQHGNRATAHAALRQAQQKLTPGGLFCLRVNAVGTDLWPDHELTEQHPDGGFTICYLAGPKTGLQIHFFSAPELTTLFTTSFHPILPLRLDQTRRISPQPGQWSQWEAIWRLGTT